MNINPGESLSDDPVLGRLKRERPLRNARRRAERVRQEVLDDFARSKPAPVAAKPPEPQNNWDRLFEEQAPGVGDVYKPIDTERLIRHPVAPDRPSLDIPIRDYAPGIIKPTQASIMPSPVVAPASTTDVDLMPASVPSRKTLPPSGMPDIDQQPTPPPLDVLSKYDVAQDAEIGKAKTTRIPLSAQFRERMTSVSDGDIQNVLALANEMDVRPSEALDYYQRMKENQLKKSGRKLIEAPTRGIRRNLPLAASNVVRFGGVFSPDIEMPEGKKKEFLSKPRIATGPYGAYNLLAVPSEKEFTQAADAWKKKIMETPVPEPDPEMARAPKGLAEWVQPERIWNAFWENAPLTGTFMAATSINPVLGTALMMGVEGGSSKEAIDEYEQKTGKTLSPLQRRGIPIAVGAINAAFERVGIDLLLGKGPLGKFAKRRVVKALLAAPTEGTTESAQEITSILGELGYDKDAMEGAGERIVNSFYGGLVTGGILGGVIPSQPDAGDGGGGTGAVDVDAQITPQPPTVEPTEQPQPKPIIPEAPIPEQVVPTSEQVVTKTPKQKPVDPSLVEIDRWEGAWTGSKYFDVHYGDRFTQFRYANHYPNTELFNQADIQNNADLIKIGNDLYYEVGNYRLFSEKLKNQKTINAAIKGSPIIQDDIAALLYDIEDEPRPTSAKDKVPVTPPAPEVTTTPPQGEIVAPDVKEPAQGKVKEPWEMTREEYDELVKGSRGFGYMPSEPAWDQADKMNDAIKAYIKRVGKANFTKEINENPYEGTRKFVVKQAIAENKPVPKEVMDDYPELAEQVKPTVPGAVPAGKGYIQDAIDAGRVTANTPAGQVGAKKQPDGKWKLFFRGTENEVFPGEVFASPQDARNSFKVAVYDAKEQGAKTEATPKPAPAPKTETIGPYSLVPTGAKTGSVNIVDKDGNVIKKRQPIKRARQIARQLSQEQETVRPDITPVATGKTGKAKTEAGTAITYDYALVGAKDIEASHKTTLKPNKNYPASLQPRDRTKAASEFQINKIVSNLMPERLGENPMASEGAPIINKQGFVESGNARTIALQRIYEGRGKGAAEAYKTWLADNAEQFGLTREQVESVKNPMLVRRRTSDVDVKKFVEEANVQATAAMSAGEQAQADAGKVGSDLLQQFVPNLAGDINTTANADFRRAFFSRVIGTTELGRYIDRSGNITQDGLNRIRNALFAKAYGEPSAIERLAESTDSNIKNITTAMLNVAPRIAMLDESIQDGTRHDLSISEDITAAAEKLSGLRSSGRPVDDYIRQQSMFGEDISPLAKEILTLFDANKRSARKMSIILDNYIELVHLAGDPNQADMFGGEATATREELLRQAVKAAERGEVINDVQASLFEDRPGAGEEAGRGDKPVAKKTPGEGETEETVGEPASPKSGKALAYPMNARAWDVKLAEEPTTQKTINKTDIITQTEKAFGVPIRGKVTHRWKQTIAGMYYPEKTLVRLRKWGELSVLGHELAHHIDEKIAKVRGKRWRNELFPAGKKRAITKELADLDYDQKQRRTNEGFAEFMRYYLTTDEAKAKAPMFYDVFTNKLLPALPGYAEKISSLKDKMETWRTQGAENRVLAQIDFRGEHTKVKGVKASATKAWGWFNKQFVDEFYDVRKIEKEIEGITGKKLRPTQSPSQMMDYFKAKSGAIARTFVLDKAIDEFHNPVGKGLLEVLAPIKHNEMKSFISYAISKRAMILARRGIESGFEIADSQFIIDKYSNEAWDGVIDDITEWSNHLLDWVVRAGGLGEKESALMRKLNPIYLPFMRAFVDELGAFKGTGGIVNRGQAIKGIKGSGRPVINPIESLVKQATELINKAHKIRIASLWAELSEEHGIGGFITKVPAPMKAQNIALSSIQNFKGLLEDVGLPKDIDLSDLDLDKMMTVFTQGKSVSGKDNIVSIWRNGKQEWYELHPDLARALTGIDQYKLPAMIDFIFGKPARLLRIGATGIKASFGVRNVFRDAFTYAVLSKSKFATPLDPAKGLYGEITAKEGAPIWRFKHGGGAMSGMIGFDRNATMSTYDDMMHEKLGKKGKALRIVRHPVAAIRDIISVGELAPRSVELERQYKKYKKDNPDWADDDCYVAAFNDAQDVTVNFTRSGITGKKLNQVIPFYNVAIQSPNKLYRYAKENPVGFVVKGILYLSMFAATNYWRNKDKDWYKNLPPAYKYGNFWFEFNNVVHRFPIPFDLGVIFASSIMAGMDYAKSRDYDYIKGWISQVKAQFPGITPALLGPLDDVRTNKNYLGNPIEGESLKYLPVTERRKEYTSKLGDALAQGFNKIGIKLSPVQVDYLIDGYTGGFRRQLPGREIKEAADIPIYGDLVLRMPENPRRQTERFYFDYEALGNKVKVDKATREEKTKYNKLKRMRIEIGHAFKRIKKLNSDKDQEGVRRTYTQLKEYLAENGYK